MSILIKTTLLTVERRRSPRFNVRITLQKISVYPRILCGEFSTLCTCIRLCPYVVIATWARASLFRRFTDIYKRIYRYVEGTVHCIVLLLATVDVRIF